MRALPRLLKTKYDKFFDLLEWSAAEATGCIQALSALLATPPNGTYLEQFMSQRRRNQGRQDEVVELLCESFVAPFDRHDIEALSRRLCEIPANIQRFSERLLRAPTPIRPDLFHRQIALLVQAAEAVGRLVGHLPYPMDPNEIQVECRQLQEYERAAEELRFELLCGLYDSSHTPLQMFVTRELFELLGQTMTCCGEVGNRVLQIAFKER